MNYPKLRPLRAINFFITSLVINTFVIMFSSFYLLDPESEPHPLSVTVTPCSAAVQWSMVHKTETGLGMLVFLPDSLILGIFYPQ